jgi:cysteine synthase A
MHIVSSDAFSPEKLDQMAALGAELTLVPSEGGRTTRKLILDMIEAARALSQEPHTYWIDQLNNQDSIAGYYSLAEEIWSQTKGKIDAFVHCVGTAASSRGVATVLKRYKPDVRIVVVEPAESSVLLGGQPGPHKIEGVGIGYVPPLWDPTVVDEILPVKTDDAKDMARRLAREEALFAGTSSGANVLAAIQLAERLGPGAKVVTLMADSGLKYLSTDVYSRTGDLVR